MRPPPPTRPGRLDRWWLRTVGYPQLGDPQQTTARRELLHTLRFLARALTVALLALITLFGLALTGHALPAWANTALAPTAVWLFILSNPETRGGLLGVLYASLFSRRTEPWLDAGAPVVSLWRFHRPLPISPAQYAAYTATIGTDPSGQFSGGTDPHLVFWLHAHGLGPDTLAAYRAAGLPSDQVPALHRLGVTPARWTRLSDRLCHPRSLRIHPESLVRLLTHLATGPGGRHPAATGPTRPAPSATPGTSAGATGPDTVADHDGHVDDLLDLTAAWLRVGLPAAQICPCEGTIRQRPFVITRARRRALRQARRAARRNPTSKPCPRCHRTGGHHYDPYLLHRINGAEIRTWMTELGTLAPHVIRAQMSLDEARQILRDDPAALTVEALDTLVALRDAR